MAVLSPSCGGVRELPIECSQFPLVGMPVLLKSRHLIGRRDPRDDSPSVLQMEEPDRGCER